MENHDLTVAICLYNCEKYIEQTLMCIVNQTYQKFDLLIVNDCSTDSSVERVEEFFRDNPRQYELVHFEQNRGLAAGRYYVEQNVKTKYILFVDADDCPHPTLVERLYEKITSDSDLIAVGCYHHFIDSKGKEIGGGIFMGERDKESFYSKAERKKLIFMQPTAIIDREIALRVGGRSVSGFPQGKPRYQDLCEDLDLWTRMSDLYVEGKAIVVVPEVLCNYRKHQSALSANSIGMILRMRHVKSNLLRRRAGQNEQTFVEFFDAITPAQMKSYQKDADAATFFREGVYAIKKGNLLRAILKIGHSVVLRPSYAIQKIKNNMIK